MKQYKQILPFLRCLLILAVLGQLPLFASAQGIPDPRWYFGNSPQWISFLNGQGQLVQTPAQQAIGTGGSVVATDLQTGDLLFYAGGQLVVNASGQSTALTGDASLPQPVHAVPATGIPDTYYLFVLNAQGNLQYHTYNYVQNLLGPAVPLNLGGTASGTMELIRGATPAGYVYWLVVPQVPQNGVTQISLIRIAGGAPAAPVTFSLSDLPYPINAQSIAFSEEKGLLALGSAASTDPVPLLVFSFNTQPGVQDFSRISLIDTLSNLTAQNGAISGLAWKENYLYAAKSQNAIGTSSSVYRFEIDDDPADDPQAQAIPGSSFFQGLDLKTGPDGRVYHLYRQQAGGPVLAGYVRNSGTQNPSFVPAAFGTVNFMGEHFNKLAPPPPTDYTVNFDYVNACTEAITYFYPKFDEIAPERVEWRLGGANGQIFSTQLQPIVQDLFAQPGGQSVTLTAYYPDGVETSTQLINVSKGYELQVEPEFILCPGESKWASVKVTSGGSDVDATGKLVWFKPRSVKRLNDGKANPELADSIELVATPVPDPNDPSIMTYPVAGTYFVVYNSPDGCQVSASFRVRVYNYEYSKANLWYFGRGAELDFSTGEPNPLTEYPNPMDGADEAPEGVTLAVDPNVDPLFSTNGEKLWVRDYQPIPLDDVDDLAPNGENLGGSVNVSQNSLFEPFPANPELYYLFTISGPNAVGGRALRFTVADLKGNGTVTTPPSPAISDVEKATDPVGDYIKGRLLQTDVAEKLISVRGDSSKVWVITHGLNNNRFYSFPVMEDGVGTPVESSAGSVYTENEAPGYLMASSDGTLLAAAVGKAIEIYRFDKATGKVLPDDAIRLEVSAATDNVYGVSFSPDDSRVYFTAGKKLYQTSLDSALTLSYLQKSLIEVATDTETLGAIQLAPNNRLYVARYNTQQLGVIRAPNDSVTAANKGTAYSATGLQNPLNGTTLMGLPNLRRRTGDSPNDPVVSANNACFGEDVIARGQNRYNNELYIFILKQFENNQFKEIRRTSAQEADSVVYSGLAAGRYQVELQLEACGLTYPTSKPDYEGKEPIIAEFEVYPEAEAVITNPQPINLCNQQTITLTAEIRVNGQPVDPANYAIQWISLNQVVGTGPTYEATKKGNYQVAAINIATQCPVKGMNVDVFDYRPQAELGDDISICPGGTLPASISVTNLADPSLFGIKWQRSVNFAPFQDLGNTTTTQPLNDVNTSQPGNYRYLVEIKDLSSEGCVKKDTLTIQINPSPIVNLRAANNSCDGNGADLIAQVQGTGTYSYQFFRDGTSIGSNFTGTMRVMQDGTYTVKATPSANGTSCPGESNAVVVKMNDAIASVGIDVVPGCRIPSAAGFSTLTAYTAYTGAVNFKWEQIDSNGRVVRVINQNAATVTVPDGMYRVTATAADGGCPDAAPATAEVTAKSLLSPQSVVQSNYTICPSIESRRTALVDLTGQAYQNVVLVNRTTGQQRTINQPFIMINEPGTYELKVGGCTDPAVFTVSVDCTPVLHLPNAIRPGSRNNDNTVFSILSPEMRQSIDQDNFEVLIYDRWGEVIWRSENPDFKWPGIRHGGSLVPMGSYPYLIRYKNKYGENKNWQQVIGSVFVMY